MNFNPVNRYIRVDIPKAPSPERPSGIVLPQDYAPPKQRHVVAKVISCASDVRFKEEIYPGASLVIDQSMIEEIIINNEKITVVLDNYVIGIT